MIQFCTALVILMQLVMELQDSGSSSKNMLPYAKPLCFHFFQILMFYIFQPFLACYIANIFIFQVFSSPRSQFCPIVILQGPQLSKRGYLRFSLGIELRVKYLPIILKESCHPLQSDEHPSLKPKPFLNISCF